MNEQNENHETPKNLSEDPRLTAYALGELPADEHAAFERELENEPAARAEVESIRAMAGIVEVELCQEPAETLTDSQRAAVKHEATRSRAGWRPWLVAASIGAAAFGGYLLGQEPVAVTTQSEARINRNKSVPSAWPVASTTKAEAPTSTNDTGSGDLNNPTLQNPGAVTIVFAAPLDPEAVKKVTPARAKRAYEFYDNEAITGAGTGGGGAGHAMPGGSGAGGGGSEDDGEAQDFEEIKREGRGPKSKRAHASHLTRRKKGDRTPTAVPTAKVTTRCPRSSSSVCSKRTPRRFPSMWIPRPTPTSAVF